MNAPTLTLSAGVSIEQMLAARDQRAARQSAALARFNKPLVSMTVVIPGPVKNGSLPRRVLRAALDEMDRLTSARNWRVLSREVLWQETGPEALYVIDVESRLLKLATVKLEDQHPIGRLWDLDVIGPGPRPLSRKEFTLPARRCFVCERPASECSRSRRHPLSYLLSIIHKLVNKYDLHPS